MGKNPQASRQKKSKFKDSKHEEEDKIQLMEVKAAQLGISLEEYLQQLGQQDDSHSDGSDQINSSIKKVAANSVLDQIDSTQAIDEEDDDLEEATHKQRPLDDSDSGDEGNGKKLTRKKAREMMSEHEHQKNLQKLAEVKRKRELAAMERAEELEKIAERKRQQEEILKKMQEKQQNKGKKGQGKNKMKKEEQKKKQMDKQKEEEKQVEEEKNEDGQSES